MVGQKDSQSKKPMIQDKARIISNENIKGSYWHCVAESKAISKAASPGQFVNVKFGEQPEPLLRRPFSIHMVEGTRIKIMYEVLGRSTQIFSQKKAGDVLDIIGPLGNGFDYQLSAVSRHLSVIVAGGMGVAPLVFLASKLKKRDTIVLLGAKTKNHVFCEGEFKKMGYQVKVATDDGSKGFKGKVTDLLKDILSLAISHKPLAIYACGPKPMLKEISVVSAKYNISAQISLEEHMGCGIGACLGCVVDTKDGYRRVCHDGPVFDAGQIIWRE